jgi:acyl-CoA thioesterase-1
MRRSLALAVLGIVACSRSAPGGAPPVEPPPPVAKEDPALKAKTTTTSLRLAVGVEEAKDAGASAESAEGATATAPALPSLSGKTVLHVGDSMVGGEWGLTRALHDKFDKEGAKFVRDYKVSESIVSFDKSSKLKELLAKHKPDIVILTLGTNDVFVPYPAALAPNVQNIVKRMGSRECYWMGPPLWKPDTGIVGVIRDNAAPCTFFDASNLKLARGHDGIHPTDKGGSDWADSFWAFMRKPGRATPAAPSLLGDAGVTAPE